MVLALLISFCPVKYSVKYCCADPGIAHPCQCAMGNRVLHQKQNKLGVRLSDSAMRAQTQLCWVKFCGQRGQGGKGPS